MPAHSKIGRGHHTSRCKHWSGPSLRPQGSMFPFHSPLEKIMHPTRRHASGHKPRRGHYTSRCKDWSGPAFVYIAASEYPSNTSEWRGFGGRYLLSSGATGTPQNLVGYFAGKQTNQLSYGATGTPQNLAGCFAGKQTNRLSSGATGTPRT